MGLVNHKLIEIVEDDGNHVYDGDFRACDFDFEGTGVFLSIKCYNSREKKKYRKVRICLTDFLLQIWKKLSNEQKQAMRPQIEMVLSK